MGEKMYAKMPNTSGLPLVFPAIQKVVCSLLKISMGALERLLVRQLSSGYGLLSRMPILPVAFSLPLILVLAVLPLPLLPLLVSSFALFYYRLPLVSTFLIRIDLLRLEAGRR